MLTEENISLVVDYLGEQFIVEMNTMKEENGN